MSQERIDRYRRAQNSVRDAMFSMSVLADSKLAKKLLSIDEAIESRMNAESEDEDEEEEDCCEECGGSGLVDSGGVREDGSFIEVPCVCVVIEQQKPVECEFCSNTATRIEHFDRPVHVCDACSG